MTTTQTQRKRRTRDRRVLAIDPSTKGLAFIVFEGPDRLLDWGFAHVPRRHRLRTVRFEQMLNRFRPDVVVLEDSRAEVGVDVDFTQ